MVVFVGVSLFPSNLKRNMLILGLLILLESENNREEESSSGSCLLNLRHKVCCWTKIRVVQE